MDAGWRTTSGEKVTILCLLDDIPLGGAKGVLPNHRGRDQVILIRQSDRIYGYVNNCPHYDKAPLGWKKDAFLDGDRQHIMCAAHGALFRIDTGECVIGPCLGQGLTPVRVVLQGSQVILDQTL